MLTSGASCRRILIPTLRSFLAAERVRTLVSRSFASSRESSPRQISRRAEPWELKDLRKTCATYYDEHVPESSIEILGHSVGGITYRHYAHRAPLAFRAIMTLPQPTAFSALARGFDGECPCCRRKFPDAAYRRAR